MPIKVYFEDAHQMLEENDPLLLPYTPIKAAGGLVVNDDQQVLLIFRRGKWDLPKGKYEPGETIEECALREVEEETGLTNLQLQQPLLVTYHTYSDKGVKYIKDTHWFLLQAPGKQRLIPQAEEEITKAKWVDRAALARYTSITYALIRDVLSSAVWL